MMSKVYNDKIEVVANIAIKKGGYIRLKKRSTEKEKLYRINQLLFITIKLLFLIFLKRPINMLLVGGQLLNGLWKIIASKLIIKVALLMIQMTGLKKWVIHVIS